MKSYFKLSQPDTTVWREVDGELLVLDVDTGAYYSGNAVALQIWQGLLSGESSEQVIAQLASQYELSPEMIAEDVREFIAETLNRELLTEVE